MNDAIIHGSINSKLESTHFDYNPKKSASFGDFSANLLKSIYSINNDYYLVEGKKTDFSIVAPKND